jgi:hypothetical protein
VGVGDPLVERADGAVGIVAADDEVRGVKVDGEASGVEAGQERHHRFGAVEAGVERDRHAGAVAVSAQRFEAFPHQRGGGIVRQPVPYGTRLADLTRLNDHEPGAEIEGEGHRLADLLHARLQIFRDIEAASKRADQGRHAEVMRTQEVRDLTSARLRQALRQ